MVVAYWTPTDPEKAEDTLIYVLKHSSREAADASWAAFIADPEWTAVAEASNANGPILGGIEREYMIATDYSPFSKGTHNTISHAMKTSGVYAGLLRAVHRHGGRLPPGTPRQPGGVSSISQLQQFPHRFDLREPVDRRKHDKGLRHNQCRSLIVFHLSVFIL